MTSSPINLCIRSTLCEPNRQAAERSYKFYKGFKNSNVMHAQEQDYANLKKVAREVKKTSVLNWQDISEY